MCVCVIYVHTHTHTHKADGQSNEEGTARPSPIQSFSQYELGIPIT
jgi:hypothetical protein